MGTGGSGVPGPTLFLLVVLLPSLMSKKSFLHSIPRSRDFHHLSLSWRSLHSHLSQDGRRFQHSRSLGAWQEEKHKKDKKLCSNDLYFILDNPKMRMSFITYSTHGETIMKLTSDKKEIRDGLRRLQNVVPTGLTNMQEGFKLANEQIEKVNSGENKVPAIIITLTDGTLLKYAFEETRKEAARARKMGTTIYGVGVNDYKEKQLLAIADSKYHTFGVNTGFTGLKDIVDSLATRSCIEITTVKPSSICAKENYELNVSGKGFKNAKNKNEVICRFKFSKNKVFDKKATSVKDTNLTCPGIKIESSNQEVFIEVSLNNGISFINDNIRIISEDCSKKSTVPPATPPPSAVLAPTPPLVPPHAPLPTQTPAPPPPWPPALPSTPPPRSSPTLPPAKPPVPPPDSPRSPLSETPPTPSPALSPVPPPDPPPDPLPDPPPDPPPETRSDPHPDPPPDPSPDPTPDPTSAPTPSQPPPLQFIPMVNPLYFLGLISALLMLLLLFWCIWWLSCKRTIKKSPPVQDQEKEPETCHIQTCPTVIVPCCGCQVGDIKRIECKLDTLYDFVQSCNQVPLTCHPKVKGKCVTFAPMKPCLRQLPCSPKICLGPNQEFFPLNSCYSWCQHPSKICSQPPSRMLSLNSPPSRALCRTTLCLPHP
ncbi:hypothetical protein HJG60_010873 [Phyllostomus discolor]|uniref:VWFA domain-containing protein n=1 Tax=Phyllostomus discolor TaxID=89673 RepID=A0A834A7Q8_9CHIR|nr:hypothetical protein HJG60_010873 [Phyllostomus discolor]